MKKYKAIQHEIDLLRTDQEAVQHEMAELMAGVKYVLEQAGLLDQDEKPEMPALPIPAEIHTKATLPQIRNAGRNPLVFEGSELKIVDHQGRMWVTAEELGRALGYSNIRRGSQTATPFGRIMDVYRRHADEFTDEMTTLIEIDTAGGRQKVRVFSPRGCHIVGMFARTKRAAAFRRWVLDVLEKEENHPIVKASTVNSSDGLWGFGSHDEELTAFLALTKGRMGGRRNMPALVSVQTAKVLCWYWNRCLDEAHWYAASCTQIGRDLDICYRTSARCTKRLARWGFIEQRHGRNENVVEYRLFRSIIKTELAGIGVSGEILDTDKRPALLPGRFQNTDVGSLAAVAGSPAAALVLAKAIEMQERAGKPGAWWCKSLDEWARETSMGRHRLDAARKRLRNAGILKENRRGMPAKLWYLLDEDVLECLLRPRRIAAVEDGRTVWH